MDPVPWRPMNRVLSGIAPSGSFTLGNYLGALRQWVPFQDGHDAFYCVVDLHALTTEIDPAELRANTLDAALNLLAVGLDPERLHAVRPEPRPRAHPAHLAARVHDGHGRAAPHDPVQGQVRPGQEASRVGLFTYPCLMAADILLYDADAVPVGDDQRQHLELARELAIRFNNRYGETFVVPEAAIPGTAARVMDLQHPERKMSKSVDSPLGTIGLLDSDDDITRKVRKAVTDTDGEVRYDREKKPGLANLLELLAAATDRTPRGRGGRVHPLRRPQERRRRCARRVAAPHPRATPRARERPRATSTLSWRAGRPRRTRWRRRRTRGPRTPWGCLPPYGSDAGGRGLGQKPEDALPPAVELVEQPRDRAVGVQEEVEEHEPEQDGHRVLAVAQVASATSCAAAAARRTPSRRAAVSESG